MDSDNSAALSAAEALIESAMDGVRVIPCPPCRGTGKIVFGMRCRECEGKGKVIEQQGTLFDG